MLTIQNVVIERQKRRILEVEFLKVEPQHHVSVLGPNGVGKSSLLKAICGEWPTLQGEIKIHQRMLSQWHRRTLACHLGVLPQASKVDFPFTASEVVAIGATPLSFKQRELPARIMATMRKTDVAHLAQKPFALLSGGEKQRVQLARVLLQLSQAEYSPVLLMDEPTSAQDLGHQHELMSLVNQLCRDEHYSVVSVLHDLNLASRYADEVWIIDQQKIVKRGYPEHVLTPSTVEAHWQYRPERVNNLKHGFALF